MAKTQQKTWVDQEILTHSDLNTEFQNIYTSPMALISPATAALDMNAQTIILSADQADTIKASTDNQIDVTVNSSVVAYFKDGVLDMNGNRMDFNTDGDSSIRESADDVITLELQAFDSIIFDGDVASPVNGLTFQTAATGNPASILPHGEAGCSLKIEFADDLDSSLRETSDDVVALELQAFDSFIFDGSVGTPVNGLTFASTATPGTSVAGSPTITSHGESNVGMNLVPKGSGSLFVKGETLCNAVYNATVAWNPGSIDDGNEEAKEITVTGAALGDIALAAINQDTLDLTLTATVTAADTVTVILANNTGGAVDVASGQLRVKVLAWDATVDT